MRSADVRTRTPPSARASKPGSATGRPALQRRRQIKAAEQPHVAHVRRDDAPRRGSRQKVAQPCKPSIPRRSGSCAQIDPAGTEYVDGEQRRHVYGIRPGRRRLPLSRMLIRQDVRPRRVRCGPSSRFVKRVAPQPMPQRRRRDATQMRILPKLSSPLQTGRRHAPLASGSVRRAARRCQGRMQSLAAFSSAASGTATSAEPLARAAMTRRRSRVILLLPFLGEGSGVALEIVAAPHHLDARRRSRPAS